MFRSSIILLKFKMHLQLSTLSTTGVGLSDCADMVEEEREAGKPHSNH